MTAKGLTTKMFMISDEDYQKLVALKNREEKAKARKKNAVPRTNLGTVDRHNLRVYEQMPEEERAKRFQIAEKFCIYCTDGTGRADFCPETNCELWEIR